MVNIIFAPLNPDEYSRQTANVWIKAFGDSEYVSFSSPREAETGKYMRRSTSVAYANKQQQLIYSDPYFQNGRKSGLVLVLDCSAVAKAGRYVADVIGAGCPPGLSSKEIATNRQAQDYISNFNLVQTWLDAPTSVNVLSDDNPAVLYVLDQLIVLLKNKAKQSGETLLLYTSKSNSDEMSFETLQMLKTVLKRLPVGVANGEVSFSTAARIVGDCIDTDIACTTQKYAESRGEQYNIDIDNIPKEYRCDSYFGKLLQANRADLPTDLANSTTIDELESIAAKLLFDDEWNKWVHNEFPTQQDFDQLWDIYTQAHIENQEKNKDVLNGLCDKFVDGKYGKQLAIIYWLKLSISEQSQHLNCQEWKATRQKYVKNLPRVAAVIKEEFAARERRWIRNVSWKDIKSEDADYYAGKDVKAYFSVDDLFAQYVGRVTRGEEKLDFDLFKKYLLLASAKVRQCQLTELFDKGLFDFDKLFNVQNVGGWLGVARKVQKKPKVQDMSKVVEIISKLFSTAKFSDINEETIKAWKRTFGKGWKGPFDAVDSDKISNAFYTMLNNSTVQGLSDNNNNAFVYWMKFVVEKLPKGIDAKVTAQLWEKLYKQFPNSSLPDLRNAILSDFDKQVFQTLQRLPDNFFDVEDDKNISRKAIAKKHYNDEELVSWIKKNYSTENGVSISDCKDCLGYLDQDKEKKLLAQNILTRFLYDIAPDTSALSDGIGWEYKSDYKEIYKLLNPPKGKKWCALDALDIIFSMEGASSIIDDSLVTAFEKLKKTKESMWNVIKNELFQQFNRYFENKDNWKQDGKFAKESEYEKLKSSLEYTCETVEKERRVKQKEEEFEKIKSYLCNGEQFRKDFPSISREQRIPLTSEEQEKRRYNVVTTVVSCVLFLLGLFVTMALPLIYKEILGWFGLQIDIDYIIRETTVLYGNRCLYPYSPIATWADFLNLNNYLSLLTVLYFIWGVASLVLGIAACWQYKPNNKTEINNADENGTKPNKKRNQIKQKRKKRTKRRPLEFQLCCWGFMLACLAFSVGWFCFYVHNAL